MPLLRIMCLNAIKPEVERKMYNVEPRLPLDTDVLKYCDSNKERFPRLSFLARRYLVIQASNTASERMGSISNCTISKWRTNLQGVNAAKLIKLKKNLPLL